MDGDLYTEASLSDSVIFQTFNHNAEMSQIITSALSNSIVITPEYIEEQILQIKRTNISPLAENVMKAYEEGDITLLYANVKKIPQALPFFVTKMKGKIKAFVFVNNFGTLTKQKNGSNQKFLNISMKDLYVLMEGALTAYTLAYLPQRANKSLALMKLSCNIYTNMILRILNKEYAISIEQDLYAKIAFVIGKFFITKVWGYTNENIVFNYARSTINSVISSTELLVINQLYDETEIKNIQDLMKFIATFSPRLGSLNFRYFVQCFINTYKATSMFGMECLPYFLFTIQSSMIGSFIVNQPIISDITKTIKGMNNFYPELVKIII